MYGGLKDPQTGAQLYPGLAPGSEPFWPNRDPANPFPIPIAHYKWLVFADPNWDWKSFEFSDPADYQAHQKAEAKFAPILNATDPNLSAFRQRGGKLLQYHGWNDQLITPLNSINYYESVLSFFGRRPGSCRHAAGRPELLPVVHGAGHGALRRRTGSEHVRHAGGAGAMGGTRHRPGRDRRHPLGQRRSRPVCVRSAPTRRSPSTKGPATRTTPRTSPVAILPRRAAEAALHRMVIRRP